MKPVLCLHVCYEAYVRCLLCLKPMLCLLVCIEHEVYVCSVQSKEVRKKRLQKSVGFRKMLERMRQAAPPPFTDKASVSVACLYPFVLTLCLWIASFLQTNRRRARTHDSPTVFHGILPCLKPMLWSQYYVCMFVMKPMLGVCSA